MPTIFEQIIEGKIPSYKIAESKDFFSFLDIHPKSYGHTLVIPKYPYRWVWEVPNFGAYLEFCKKISLALQDALNPSFVSIHTHGMDIPHAHIHLIPSYLNKSEYSKSALNFIPSEFQQIASKISQMLK